MVASWCPWEALSHAGEDTEDCSSHSMVVWVRDISPHLMHTENWTPVSAAVTSFLYISKRDRLF